MSTLSEMFVKISPDTGGLKAECARLAKLFADIAALLSAYAAEGSSDQTELENL